MAIVPEDGIVAIARSNSEDDLTIPLQRALPPSGEESLALTIESPASPDSMYFNLSNSYFFIADEMAFEKSHIHQNIYIFFCYYINFLLKFLLLYFILLNLDVY